MNLLESCIINIYLHFSEYEHLNQLLDKLIPSGQFANAHSINDCIIMFHRCPINE